MKLKAHERIPATVAEVRALKAMSFTDIRTAATIADAIWPGHSMTRQGAGAAASRILKRLQDRALVRWTSRASGWGWIKC